MLELRLGYYSEITRSDEILSLSQCLDQDKAVAQKKILMLKVKERLKNFTSGFFFSLEKKSDELDESFSFKFFSQL